MTTEERVTILQAAFAGNYWDDENARAVFTAALNIERCTATSDELHRLVMGSSTLQDRYPVLASALSFLVVDECLEGLPDWRKVGSVWPLPVFWMPRERCGCGEKAAHVHPPTNQGDGCCGGSMCCADANR